MTLLLSVFLWPENSLIIAKGSVNYNVHVSDDVPYTSSIEVAPPKEVITRGGKWQGPIIRVEVHGAASIILDVKLADSTIRAIEDQGVKNFLLHLSWQYADGRTDFLEMEIPIASFKGARPVLPRPMPGPFLLKKPLPTF